MLYSQSDDRRGFGRGNRGRFGRGRHGRPTQERNSHQWQEDKNRPRKFGKRGSHPAGSRNRNNPIECGYCGKHDHYEEECRKKIRDWALTTPQLMNYSSNSDYDNRGRMFVMRHEPHSMSTKAPTSTSSSDSIWFVNSGASNHMTSHEDWFGELRMPDPPDYVETGDDTTHPSRHVGNVPFGNDGKQTYLKNV